MKKTTTNTTTLTRAENINKLISKVNDAIIANDLTAFNKAIASARKYCNESNKISSIHMAKETINKCASLDTEKAKKEFSNMLMSASNNYNFIAIVRDAESGLYKSIESNQPVSYAIYYDLMANISDLSAAVLFNSLTWYDLIKVFQLNIFKYYTTELIITPSKGLQKLNIDTSTIDDCFKVQSLTALCKQLNIIVNKMFGDDAPVLIKQDLKYILYGMVNINAKGISLKSINTLINLLRTAIITRKNCQTYNIDNSKVEIIQNAIKQAKQEEKKKSKKSK